jgi:hypothetical protein
MSGLPHSSKSVSSRSPRWRATRSRECCWDSGPCAPAARLGSRILQFHQGSFGFHIPGRNASVHTHSVLGITFADAPAFTARPEARGHRRDWNCTTGRFSCALGRRQHGPRWRTRRYQRAGGCVGLRAQRWSLDSTREQACWRRCEWSRPTR